MLFQKTIVSTGADIISLNFFIQLLGRFGYMRSSAVYTDIKEQIEK